MVIWFCSATTQVGGKLKRETKVTDSAYQPFRLQNQYADGKTSCTTTSSGIMNLTAEDLSIRIRLGWEVEVTFINFRQIYKI